LTHQHWPPGRAFGDRYSLPETKSMLKKDPLMLDYFTDKELVEIKASLEELQQVKQTGFHANHQAVVADTEFTLNQLSEKVRQDLGLVLVLNNNLDQQFGRMYRDNWLCHVHPEPHPQSSTYSHH
jgi:hypothetical protein